MTQPVMNFSEVKALVVDADRHLTSLIAQMLRGFGITSQYHFASGKETLSHLEKALVDLCIVEAVLPDMSGYDLVKSIRSHPNQKLRFVPIMILTGYTQMASVSSARDSGANIVVKKPVSPKTLYDHIGWMSQSERPFVEVGGYVGPDRRFKDEGPQGTGRRAGDQADERASPLEVAQSSRPESATVRAGEAAQ